MRWLSAQDKPVVTYGLIIVSAAVFLLSLLFPFVSWFGTFYAPFLYPGVSGSFEPWRLVTADFVHASILHIGLNMLSLWMLGRIVEPLIGHGRFLALYLISALGGWVAVTLFAFDTPVVGASGAIFGVFGAMAVIARHLGSQMSGILIVLGINLVIGFVPSLGIAWQAHLGGVVTGAVIGALMLATRRPDQRGVQILGLVGVCVLLLAALSIPALIQG